MRRIIFFCLVLAILYILVFPSALSKETILEPVWALNLADPIDTAPASSGSESLHWFRLGEVFGYFDMDGRLGLTQNVHFDVTLSKTGFTAPI